MEKFNDIDWQWIQANIREDVSRLRLKYSKDSRRLFEIVQIDCRQRYQKKLASTLAESPHFIFDSTLAGEQSTSDDLAEFHASLLYENDRVLDMTGGLGIDAIHAARRVSAVTMVELDGDRAACARQNVQQLGLDVTVVNGDSIELLGTYDDDSFDVIYIDPARRGEHGERLYALKDCRPDVVALIEKMFRVADRVVVKASPMLDVTQIRRELPAVKEIVAVGTRDECKELDIVCHRGWSDGCRLGAVTILGNGAYRDFFIEEEELESGFDTPSVGDYLYEPYPAVRKLNAGGALCGAYGVIQIAPDSHFYFSQLLESKFPGESFEVLDVRDSGKKAMREISEAYPRIDVTARNFPMTAAELTKRLKVKPSGLVRLFACRDKAGRGLLIVCRRV